MKIRIKLSQRWHSAGPGSTLDQQVIETDDVAVSDDILDALKAWKLAPGDVITIEEVS